MKQVKLLIVIVLACNANILNSQVIIKDDGKVGIGIDEPAVKLHVNGSVRGNQDGALRINTGYGYLQVGPTNTSFAHFRTDHEKFWFQTGITINDGIISSHVGDDLVLCIDGGDEKIRVTIDSGDVVIAGDVAIGYSEPNYELDVLGQVASYGEVLESDIRLKKDIQPLESGIDKIVKLNPISFKYSAEDIKLKQNVPKGDDIVMSDSIDIEPDPIVFAFCNTTKFGFSAQDIQEVFPELVATDSHGYLSINYDGIIPILVNAIKEQQSQIETLQAEIESLQGTGSKTKSTADKDFNITSTLFQNQPNPFSENTYINYIISDDVDKATIYIYNLQGRQVKIIDINERGQGSAVIYGSELYAGTYHYTLITDGQIVGTYTMILTN